MASGGNLPIGPGIWGFIAFFVLAVALWLLVRNMNTRLRRMAYRDRERADAEANVLTTPSAPGDADRVHGPHGPHDSHGPHDARGGHAGAEGADEEREQPGETGEAPRG